MKYKLLLLLCLIASTAFSQRYYKLTQQYDSVAVRKLIMTSITEGGASDSVLVKKPNGGMFKVARSGFTGTIQTLSLGATNGNIAISSGNNITLNTLGQSATYNGDANAVARFALAGLSTYVNGSSSTNFPSTGGGAGILLVRIAGSTSGAIEINRPTGSDSTVYFRNGNTSSGWSPWMVMASKSHVATRDALKQNLVTLTTTGTSGASTFNQGTGALNIPTYSDAQTLSLGTPAGNIVISGGNNVSLTSVNLGSGYTGDANSSTLFATAGFYPYFNGSGSTNYPTTGGAGFRIVPVATTTGRILEMWASSSSDSTIYMRKGIGSGNYSPWMPIVSGGTAKVSNRVIINPTGNTYTQDSGVSESGPGLYLSRTFSTGSTNEHGFIDRTTFGRTSVAYNSYDAQPILTGTTMDHYDSFQARPNIQNVIDEIRGHSFIPRLNVSGSVNNMYGVRIYAPTGTAAANVTNNYGLYVASMGSGTAKKLAINIESDSTHFGGMVNGFGGFDSRNGTGYFVNGQGALSYDGSTSLGINKTSTLRDIKFYSGADGGTPKLTLSNPGTIVSRPEIASDNLKLEYDGSNSTGFKTSSAGNLTITPSGGQVNVVGAFATGDLYLSNVPPTLSSGYTLNVRDNTTGQVGKISSNTYVLSADILSGSATLDFPNTPTGATSLLTFTVTGAVAGDVVSLGIPTTGTLDSGHNVTFTAFVASANTISVVFGNNSGADRDPTSATFKVKVFK